MGIRYIAYRIVHEIEKRIGLLQKRFPINPANRYFISLNEWKNSTPQFIIGSRKTIKIEKIKSKELEEKALRIMNGELQYFHSEWKNIGKDYDWITNPENGYTYPLIHWSEIADFSIETGDIKYIWEKSRFTYFQTVIRYDYHFDKDNSEWIFAEMDSWILANPINQGPNWRCSQEISLRLMNWCYALYFYKDSPSLTEQRWAVYQDIIFWKLHHIYHHINFSRIAVRNNHAITETGMLFLSDLLFPFIPEVKKWANKGKKWLEKEIDYQIYEDGTFLQFSMNYHRVVIQLLTIYIKMDVIHKVELSEKVFDKAYKSIKFLNTCQDQVSGQLPNYGANDGALFFNWTNLDYRDYRPQLNTLHKLLTGSSLYDTSGEWERDSSWFGVDDINLGLLPIEVKQGIHRFDIGGYYIIREGETVTFLRCGNHKDRPSHADNLHLDVWVRGENILRDAGSYQYNTSKELSTYFMGTASHNTVMIDENDQMLKGSRFIWFYWSQAKSINVIEKENYFELIGEVNVFGQLRRNIVHRRKIRKYKDTYKWNVKDELLNFDNLFFTSKQLWHPNDLDKLKINNSNDDNSKQIINGWYSPCYGIKEKVEYLTFSFDQSISTTIEYIA